VTTQSSPGRIRTVLDRPRLWRATAGLAALLLCVLIVAAAQGSITVIVRRPAGGAAAGAAAGGASWQRWCGSGRVRDDRIRLAWCARVDGLVLDTTHGPGPLENHVAVVGGFHLTIVRLPDGAPTPGRGSRLIAVGPLLRARDGQREVQAFRVLRG
jgi:hypothetical protein